MKKPRKMVGRTGQIWALGFSNFFAAKRAAPIWTILEPGKLTDQRIGTLAKLLGVGILYNY